MDARVYGETTRFVNGSGKKVMEWDLNDWHWNGNLFLATPANASPSDCGNKRLFPTPASTGLSLSSPSGSDDSHPGISGKGNGDLEKRRRIVILEEDEPVADVGSLALKLGRHANGVEDVEIEIKRSKMQAGSSNRGMCQVEGCCADLSGAKDYHRRHKVCEAHAKASEAIVGNVVQRFCQQCSRFHLLQEFDDGKRSCRRRLAGHNKRRRKTQPDAVVTENPISDDRSSSYLLISLLRILSNLQSNNTEKLKDQDLVSHFLRSLASLAGSSDSRNLSALLRGSQDPEIVEHSAATSAEVADGALPNGATAKESLRPSCSMSRIKAIPEVQDSMRTSVNELKNPAIPAQELSRKGTVDCFPDSTTNRLEKTVERSRLKSFDLNDVYNEEVDTEAPENINNCVNPGINSLKYPSYMMQESHQSSSPPQTSGNSDSASVQSLVSSNGDAKGRTNRVVFKLFGKDPNDIPHSLRSQMLDWLSNTPSDIESYIRPGCIILTVYLHLSEFMWKELCNSLGASLLRLLDLDTSEFWRTGWMYVRMQHQMAFVYNGQLLLDSPFLGVNNHCTIWSLTPIAVTSSASSSAAVKFSVKGLNLAWSSMRLLCAFDGKYLTQETSPAIAPIVDADDLNDGFRSFTFSCSLPNDTGRGFIEIEDQSLHSSFFPFIVAEEEVCSEVRMLETAIDTQNNFQEKSASWNARSEALDFLHEMGWLLRRSQLESRGEDGYHHPDAFSVKRFKWLMGFAIGRDWHAVVKKLLDIFCGGAVDLAGRSAKLALEELTLLHLAVQKNSRSIVKLLLNYVPEGYPQRTESHNGRSYLFRPDMLDPAGLTPLHLVASLAGAESVLDALTDDPDQVGISAWKNARDSIGKTPEDYARDRCYQTYMHLVEQKITKRSGAAYVVLDIPASSAVSRGIQMQLEKAISSKLTGFEISKGKPHCKVCSRQQLSYIGRNRSTLLYKPAILSMVGIAVVCVCLGLLLKGLPEVRYVLSPFRWETTRFGPI